MASSKSIALGLIGLILLFFSLSFGAYSLGVSVFSSMIMNLFSVDLRFVIELGIMATFISLLMFLIGVKLVTSNENKLLKFGVGIMGILFIIAGVIIGLASAGIGIFFALVFVAVGFAFIGYGFKIDALNPLTKILLALRNFKLL